MQLEDIIQDKIINFTFLVFFSWRLIDGHRNRGRRLTLQGLNGSDNLPIQSLLVASSTGTDQEIWTGLPNGTLDAERTKERFCSTISTSSASLSCKRKRSSFQTFDLLSFSTFLNYILLDFSQN